VKTLLLLVAGALSTVSVASAAAPASPGKPSVTIRVLEVQTRFGGTISTNAPPKPGDQIWLRSEFYRWHGATRGAHVGHVDVVGIFSPTDTLIITGTASLPGGTLSVVGVAGQQRVFSLPVVGGTGIYATARGEVTIRGIGGPNSNLSADTIRLWM
jgi:hypothetical protein